jgi:hypothetical protein
MITTKLKYPLKDKGEKQMEAHTFTVLVSVELSV